MDDTELIERFAAAFIAEHSEVLFAVCGEEEKNEYDTTAEIIKWIREGSITREFSLRQNKQSLDTMDTSMIIEIDPASGRVKSESAPSGDDSATELSGSKKGHGFPVSLWRAVSHKFFGLVQSASALLDDLYDSFFKRSGDINSDRYGNTPSIGIMERIDGFNHDISNYFEDHGEEGQCQ